MDRVSVALYQPSIPPNTGNIGRLCVGFGIPLYLIKPLGFDIDDATRKRAGLDYWKHLQYRVFENFKIFYDEMLGVRENKKNLNYPDTTDFNKSKNLSTESNGKSRIIVLSKFSEINLFDFSFKKRDIILMGNENQGVPQSVTEKHGIIRIKIPILGNIRSYNLANATAIAIYESYRQLQWRGEKNINNK